MLVSHSGEAGRAQLPSEPRFAIAWRFDPVRGTPAPFSMSPVTRTDVSSMREWKQR